MTDIEGTTRDILKETLDFGIPVTLIDTAGIRNDNVSKVEEIGIEYSKQSIKDADLVLFLYDINDGMTQKDEEIFELIKDKKYIKIANKADLNDIDTEDFKISALTKSGIEQLTEKIKSLVCDINPENLEYSTNFRQQNCLEKAKEHLFHALAEAKNRQLQDLISIDVKSALLSLEELTGEVITDDILNNIFENFCIGK